MIIGLVVTGLIIIFLFAMLLAFPTMWLWNWLCPELFHLPYIVFWQAFGLNMLCGILFKSSSSYSTNNKNG